MTMGSRIRAARLERGLSQRQLAGDEITRNMLSALENDGANPSVATLRYLSERLGRPISYFLGEDFPGAAEMAGARDAYRAGDHKDCLARLRTVAPGPFDQEKGLLKALATLALAEDAIGQGRQPYARSLLDQVEESENLYIGPALKRQCALLRARAGGSLDLTGEDEVLLLRARDALAQGRAEFAARLLEAAQERSPEWQYLRAEAHSACGEFAQAIPHYQAAEGKFPVARQLERCFLEQEDYKNAYYYSKKKEEFP